MRRLIVVAALLSTACGGSSPTGPGPIPQPTTVTISGRVLTTVTGEPIAGASLTLSGRTIQTAVDGRWSLEGQAQNATLPVEISATGYLTRNTTIRTDNGRVDLTVDLIRDVAPFNLGFYRQFVRDAFDIPGGIAQAPLRRWTRNPNFYIQTLNPKTGVSITSSELASLEATIRATVPQLTGGTLSVGSVSSGLDARSDADTITLLFEYDPAGQFCGRSLVGANPGRITINYDRCPCGGLSVVPETIAHEIGHALGYFHTNNGGIMDNNRVRSCQNTTFSAAELHHARIAYARSPGNLDVDRDGSNVSLLTGFSTAPVVSCRR